MLPMDGSAKIDERLNENTIIASIATLFVREHNRKATLLRTSFPEYSDEEIFQRARAWVEKFVISGRCIDSKNSLYRIFAKITWSKCDSRIFRIRYRG